VSGFLTSRITRWSVWSGDRAVPIANLHGISDDYDQAKQAFTSFEMIEHGHWFTNTPELVVARSAVVAGFPRASYAILARGNSWRLPILSRQSHCCLLLRSSEGLWTSAGCGACALSFNLFAPGSRSLVGRHAARARPVRDRVVDLGKIRTRASWTRARSAAAFPVAQRGDADQRADRLRVSVCRSRAFMADGADEGRIRSVVRMVALAGFVSRFPFSGRARASSSCRSLLSTAPAEFAGRSAMR